MHSKVSLLLVALRAVTEARSSAVAVARLAIASKVLFWCLMAEAELAEP